MTQTTHPSVTTVQVRKHTLRYCTCNSRLEQIANSMNQTEPDLLDWLDAIPQGAVLYDLGASNGCFSLYAAARGLRVVAIEAEAQNFAVLEMNHYLNRDQIDFPITSIHMALSSERGLDTLYVRDCVAGTHVKILGSPEMVMDKQIFEAKHRQSVLKDRLDDLIAHYQLPKPEYIKMDIDGSEYSALLGAQQTLLSPRLREVFIEITYPEGRGRETKELIESHGLDFIQAQQVEHYEGLMNCLFRRKQV